MGHIHAGKTVKPGGRYDRVIQLLEDCGARGATGLEMEQGARIRAGATVVSELRAMGYRIDSADEGSSPLGGRIWRYWLRGKPGQFAAPAPPPAPVHPPPPVAVMPAPSAPVQGELFARPA